MKFLVQRANSNSKEWKTLATKASGEEAEEQLATSIKHYSTGKFRILDPECNVIKEQAANFLFSNN